MDRPAKGTPAGQGGKPTIFIEPFTGSSAAATIFARELYEDVQRAVANLTGSILVTDLARADYIARVNVLLAGSHCRATGRLQHRLSTEDFASERFDVDIDDRLEGIDQLGAVCQWSAQGWSELGPATRFRNIRNNQ